MPDKSTILAGLSLATGIAREATDEVPIVKQVLGVAARIVDLAEQVEKNREDLHALADRAKNMNAAISAVVADRELDENMLRQLEGIKGVLLSVEQHFSAHANRGRIRKAFGYIFTIRKKIEHLKGEFDDRLREFEVAASIDTNIIARENSGFVGEFHNIRHSEIEIIRSLAPHCHIATYEGSQGVFVVRYIMPAASDENGRRQLQEKERILETMSFSQNRHPAIAYIYGRNTGPKHNRFVVLKAGDVRMLNKLEMSERQLPLLCSIVAKTLNALIYLRGHCAVWNPRTWWSNLCLDKNYEPKIGIVFDLSPVPYTFMCCDYASIAADILRPETLMSDVSHTQLRSYTWCPQFMIELMDAGYFDGCNESSIRRSDISNLIPLTPEARRPIAWYNVDLKKRVPRWGDILLSLALDNGGWEGYALRIDYYSYELGGGILTVSWTEGDAEMVYHCEASFSIPPAAEDHIRQYLGIGKEGDFFLAHDVHPGATTAESTGWLEIPEGGLW